MKIADFFELRVVRDKEGQDTLSKLLKVILTVALTVIPIAMLLRYFDDDSFSPPDLVLFLLFLTYAFSYYLIKKGDIFAGSLLFIISGWIAMTIMAGRSAGIKDVSIIGYILLIYLATLLTGYIFAITLTLFSVISIWVMAVLQHSGVLIPYQDPPIQYARDFTVFIILVLTALILFERSFRYSYLRIQNELRERTAAEERLSLNEMKLLKQNEELSFSKLKAEESDRLKTAFLQNISHEIRTPMNGIVGLSELMRSPGITKPERLDHINRLLSCSEQLERLIDDLIEVSKIESGAVDIVKSEFRAEELINDVNKLYNIKAAEKGLVFEIINDLDDVTIISDRTKLSQIINNLIDNAIKFTAGGSVTINGKIVDNTLIVKVSDTGIGIDKEDIPFIFDRFRQSESGLKRAFSGAGLGLTICRGNLKYLGGEMKVESEAGKGSVFTISVPVEIRGK